MELFRLEDRLVLANRDALFGHDNPYTLGVVCQAAERCVWRKPKLEFLVKESQTAVVQNKLLH